MDPIDSNAEDIGILFNLTCDPSSGTPLSRYFRRLYLNVFNPWQNLIGLY